MKIKINGKVFGAVTKSELHKIESDVSQTIVRRTLADLVKQGIRKN